MKIKNKIFAVCLSIISIGSTNASFAQIAATASNEAERAAARIIVVPYNKQNEDIRTVLDDNPYIRTAVSKVKEAFDQRGWSTVDFAASLRASAANAAFTADRQSDFKSDLLQSSGADFYVQVDVQLSKDDSGTNLTVVVTAFETHTGASFSNKSSSSGRFQTNDMDRLIDRAFDKIREEFLNTLMVKTDEIREIGRAIKIEFNLDENSKLDFDSQAPQGGYLNEFIEEWVAASAYKGRSNLEGVVEKKMIFSEVRIPLMDQETNKPYNPNRFASEIIKFLRSKGLEASRNIKGQNIFITIK
jgi:hypothetical protein